MKKIEKLVALMLGIVMISACSSFVSSKDIEKGEYGTFKAFAWASVPSECSNLIAMFWFGNDTLGKYGVEGSANLVKSITDKMPEGYRVIMLRPSKGDICAIELEAENYIWWDKGVEIASSKLSAFLDAYSRIGGKLDYIITDYEEGQSVFHIGSNNTNAFKYEAITSDPRYAKEIRPILEDRGFVFPGDSSKNDLYYVYNYSQAPDERSKLNVYIWNTLSEERRNYYISKAVYETAVKYFPAVKYSNYGSFDAKKEHKFIDNNGWKHYLGGDRYHVGTHSSKSFYGRISENLKTVRLPEGYPFKTFSITPFNSMLFENFIARIIVLSSEGEGKFQPWIAWRGYAPEGVAYGNTDYYNENILHIGLLNPDVFLFWNPEGEKYTGNVSYRYSNILSGLLHELDEVAGYPDRKTLVNSQISWDARYLLTGMQAGNKNIWRITPDLEVPGMTREKFLVSENPPKFQIANQVIEFPKGSRIYTPEEVYAPIGYWVVSPKGKEPVEIVVDDVPPAPVPDDNPYDMQKKYTSGPVWTDENSLTVKNIGSGGATLAWTAATSGIGVKSYEIYESNGTFEAAVAGDILSYDLKGLLPNRQYAYTIIAVDNAGNISENNPVIKFNTTKQQ